MSSGPGTSPSRPPPKRRWTIEYKIIAVLSAAIIVVGIGLAAIVAQEIISHHTFTPYASYDFVVAIAANESQDFRVLCPLPCNSTRDISEDIMHSLRTTSNGRIMNATTTYGEALEITGSGVVIVTFSSRANLPGPWPGYMDFRYLTLTAGGGNSLNANVLSDGGDVHFGLQFRYSHVYGNIGADFIRYESSATLLKGWNTIQVDYSHAVA